MKTTSLLTVTLITGAIVINLLVTGTSIQMSFADANLFAPGQDFGHIGGPGIHNNPSSGGHWQRWTMYSSWLV